METLKIVLTGGGTAGHIYPAINTGLYLRKKYGAEIFYIGNEHSMEERIANENDIPFFTVESFGLNMKKVIRFASKNSKGVVKALKWLRKIKPNYVFATGGYVSAPVVTAASILRIPYGVHEQNAVMGKVNKFASINAKTVFHSFPIVETKKIKYTGNPVRYKEKIKFPGEHIFFFGGSGGAEKINEFAISFAKKNPEEKCILITGKRRYEDAMKKGIPRNLMVYDYVTNMIDVYKKAKLVIVRSGSGTLFELANLNLASILIPFPNSADNHQQMNAEYFSKNNAAKVVTENQYFYEELESTILELVKKPNKMKELRTEIDYLSSRDSEQKIATEIIKTLKTN